MPLQIWVRAGTNPFHQSLPQHSLGMLACLAVSTWFLWRSYSLTAPAGEGKKSFRAEQLPPSTFLCLSHSVGSQAGQQPLIKLSEPCKSDSVLEKSSEVWSRGQSTGPVLLANRSISLDAWPSYTEFCSGQQRHAWHQQLIWIITWGPPYTKSTVGCFFPGWTSWGL